MYFRYVNFSRNGSKESTLRLRLLKLFAMFSREFIVFFVKFTVFLRKIPPCFIEYHCYTEDLLFYLLPSRYRTGKKISLWLL